MNRDKYPEKVPFRLTRMLIKAMEVSGIEGSYRSTCERTMTVLRESRDSLVAMLEAFVHDPLISWRLVDLSETENADRQSLVVDVIGAQSSGKPIEDNGAISGVPIELNGRSSLFHASITEGFDEDGDDDGDVLLPELVQQPVAVSMKRQPKEAAMSATRARSLQMYSNIQTWAANLSTDNRIASITGGEGKEQVAASGSIARSRMERSMRQRELLSILEDGLNHEEVLNEKALKVVRRVQDKLTGTDFPDREDLEPLDVSDQVQRLIVQATSVENLCQLFIGW
jgi:FKBP12-rapamycin complex-associated protein